MAREIPRTVRSFLPPFQRQVDEGDVEVIVVENGSSAPLPENAVLSWPASVRYFQLEDPSPSPARALNFGVAVARGKYVCPVIDGARMASPGLVRRALDAFRISNNSFVATIGFHLGPKAQQQSCLEGYNQATEDLLLDGINWQENGYRLFEIAALAGSAKYAWFGPVAESNAPVLSRELYTRLGGFDEQFNLPGGGLVNLDFFNRAVCQQDVRYLMLLGEATFHQYHGGITTSKSVGSLAENGRTVWQQYASQYEEIRSSPYRFPVRTPELLGTLPPEAFNLAIEGISARRQALLTI